MNNGNNKSIKITLLIQGILLNSNSEAVGIDILCIEEN
jgi:hypothetical protein